jgi:hypothetical protein
MTDYLSFTCLGSGRRVSLGFGKDRGREDGGERYFGVLLYHCLTITPPHPPREGNHLSDIWHAGQIAQ